MLYKPTCSTCRTALSLLKEHTDETIETTEYLIEVPTEDDIRSLIKMLGIKAEQLVRKKEKLYKEKFEGKKLSEAQWIKILHKNPILIERPIVIKGKKAILGRPAEKVLDIL
jgi:arsenate reductase